MDEWGIDVLVSGSQKGFMVPPGLGFVYVSEAAYAAKAECKTQTTTSVESSKESTGTRYNS